MKLLFSFVLLSAATAGNLETPSGPNDLFERWNMDEPDIQYEDTTDIFTFRFLTASDKNYDQGLAESFWNPDCMPVSGNNEANTLPVTLIHDSNDSTKLPELRMVHGMPEMKFKIDQAAFSSSDIPNVYSGDALSCTTPGQKYGLLAKNMKCSNSDVYGDDFSNGNTFTLANCQNACHLADKCDIFTFYPESGSCFGCGEGSAADLLTEVSQSDRQTGLIGMAYEMCYPHYVDYQPFTVSDAITKCGSAEAVSFGAPSMNSGRCLWNSESNPHTDLVLTKDECFNMCYSIPDCFAFTHYPGAGDVWYGNGDDYAKDRCALCLVDDVENVDNLEKDNHNLNPGAHSGAYASQWGPNRYGYETVAMCTPSDNRLEEIPAYWSTPYEQEPTSALFEDAKADHCTATTRGVSFGSPSMVSGFCPTLEVVDTKTDCYQLCLDRGCVAFTYWPGVRLGPTFDAEPGGVYDPETTKNYYKDGYPSANKGQCGICETAEDRYGTNLSYDWGPNNYHYETIAICDPIVPMPDLEVNPISRIDFCVRSSVGYTPNGDPAPVNGQNNIDQADPTSGNAISNNYQEVNFIETLVSIEYNMVSGFEVEAFSVAPKNRELTTISESYENSLIAYLCDTTATKVDYNDSDSVKVYEAPGALTDYNLIDGPYSNNGYNCDFVNNNIATYPPVCEGVNAIDAAGLAADCKACGGGITNTNGKKFNQGDLITVCVRVKEEFASQNIVLKELTDFSWTRSGGSTFNRAIGGGDDATTITQVAIQGSQAAGNYLTSYDSATCLNEYFCAFASVLFAQFYNTPGSVTGTGDAILQFQTTPTQPPTTGPDQRRLGGVDERSLQEDPGSAGMDISIDVNAVAEGPGDLKTAGGSSFGATTISVSVATALIGAILLA